ncbi:hypothetical protein LWI29_031430 [Acer saccharum]|uniref:Uncharacterized protein n=1 Tax=Acer saccharum TaxID=4024 RepID=A0AA39WAA1_ACESA|nr:hypothetical protein LWI29_031430 [Acer saccharum]
MQGSFCFAKSTRDKEVSFLVKMEEDSNLVEMEWVESFLALRKVMSVDGRSSMPEQDDFQKDGLKEVGESVQKSTS